MLQVPRLIISVCTVFFAEATAAMTAGAFIGAASIAGQWLGVEAAVNKFDIGSIVYSDSGSSIPHNTERFLGLELHDGSQTYYGWVSVKSEFVGYTGYIRGWAYQTEPGKSIVAGFIPEPSALLLGAPAFAAFCIRRRRGEYAPG